LGSEKQAMSFTFHASHFPDTHIESPSGDARAKPSLLARLLQLAQSGGTRSRPVRAIAVRPPQADWARQEQTMLRAAEAMVAVARRGNIAISFAVFDLSDLPELKSVFGSRVVQEVIAKVMAKFHVVAGNRGLVARTGPTTFALVLPGLGRDRALSLIRDVMGHPCCIELDGGDEEIVLIPEFLVQALTGEPAAVADVYAKLRRDIERAHELERKRRRYLQRERESHTRPLELGASNG
jgi:GGDEF domain-containing protein